MKFSAIPFICATLVLGLISCGGSSTSSDDLQERSSSTTDDILDDDDQTTDGSSTDGRSSTTDPGALADTSSTGTLPAFANCGPRDTTISADMYVKLSCSITVQPAKGTTVSLKAIPNDKSASEMWSYTYEFCGQRKNMGEESDPEEFSEQTSDGLSITVFPPDVGELTVDFDIVDNNDPSNRLTIPFRVKRVEP